MSEAMIRLFVPLNERVQLQDLRDILEAVVDEYGGATVLRGVGYWKEAGEQIPEEDDCAIVEVLVPAEYESAQDQITKPEGVWQFVVEELKCLGEQEVLIACHPAEVWRF